MKCPCEECISLAICNAKLKAMVRPEICVLSKVINCNELNKYIGVFVIAGGSRLDSYSDLNYNRIEDVRSTFGLEPANNRI
jgi:hypothetical protein